MSLPVPLTNEVDSKTQYERFFAKERMRKHLKADEWRHIERCITRRIGEGKTSEVLFNGVKIPSNKLFREMNRHNYQTTLERLKTGRHT